MSTTSLRRPPARPSRHRATARGFSMIEILVGVAIGMVAILVIFQTFSVFGGRSRVTGSGTDAQVAGTVGMFSLERDLRLAGLGLGRARIDTVACTVKGELSGVAFEFPLVPVQIVPNEDVTGGPVTINVLYGNSSFYSSEQTFTASTATTKTALNRAGFQLGDLVVAATPSASSAGPCALVEITTNNNADKLTLGHASATYRPFGGSLDVASRFNPSAGAGTFTEGVLYNLGPGPRLNQWRISDGRVLNVTDMIHDPTSASPLDVAEGIINMQAEYGMDTDGNGVIESWTLTQPSAAGWLGVRAIRVAILARSDEYDRTYTAPAPAWTCGQEEDGVCTFAMTDLNGAADTNPSNSPNNWRNYRYRVYEKVVPLRNMIWGTAP
jgi:type IV pilus assembly protein PilW